MQLNNFQAISEPNPNPTPTQPDSTHPRKSAYAAMPQLQERFSIVGIEVSQVWEFIKAEYSVDSRSKFTAKQWAFIAAQLQSACQDSNLFKMFVDGIPDRYFRIHVFTDDPSVAIGRPRDTGKHHISSEWDDFQAIANENQCSLTVTQGKTTTFFEPNRTPPHEPTQKTKPVSERETNARGEILYAWGDVMEVQSHDA